VTPARSFFQRNQGEYDMSDKSKTEKAKKPVHKLKDGAIELAVWLNEAEKGPFYTVTHRRSYKKGDEWKESDSYGKDDLLALAKLLDLAHTFMLLHEPQQRAKQAA
jgi:hypothetical protein